jgi:hypothetical protein
VAQEGGAGIAARAVDENPWSEQNGAVDRVVEVLGVQAVGSGVIVRPSLL